MPVVQFKERKLFPEAPMQPDDDLKPTRTDRNNPLGQRTPTDRVGGESPNMKHDQSAELVDEVKRQADEKKGQKSAPNTSGSYDPKGPERQPGKVVRQDDLGKASRKSQEGQYTQDNEEENPTV